MDAHDARTLAPPRQAVRGAVSASVATPREVEPQEQSGNADLWRGVDQAHIMSLELLVAVALWGGIGWWLDGRLGTGAWFTVIGAMIGNFAGMYLVWLRAQRLDGLDAVSHPPVADPVGAAAGSSSTPTGGHTRVS